MCFTLFHILYHLIYLAIFYASVSISKVKFFGSNNQIYHVHHIFLMQWAKNVPENKLMETQPLC